MSGTILIMAGGTGGHIYPALAVALFLRDRGWKVTWLGGPAPSMESRIVPQHGFECVTLSFGGVRGKGWRNGLGLPVRLLKAFWRSWSILKQHRPQVVLGFGGYISFTTGLMAALTRRPLVVHEQNAIAGSANRWLAPWARKRLCAFPNALPRSQWVGNPLRQAFLQCPPPQVRYHQRTGRLRILIVGGSLGAAVLNEQVPAALALIPIGQRPEVVHQSGEKHLNELMANYARHGVQGDLRSFIEDMAHEMAQADLVIARSGASTVTEVAALGVAAWFVPFAHAVDDHQTANARFLSEAGAARWIPQSELRAQELAQWLMQTDRASLATMASLAWAKGQREATLHVVAACEEVLS